MGVGRGGLAISTASRSGTYTFSKWRTIEERSQADIGTSVQKESVVVLETISSIFFNQDMASPNRREATRMKKLLLAATILGALAGYSNTANALVFTQSNAFVTGN